MTSVMPPIEEFPQPDKSSLTDLRKTQATFQQEEKTPNRPNPLTMEEEEEAIHQFFVPKAKTAFIGHIPTFTFQMIESKNFVLNHSPNEEINLRWNTRIPKISQPRPD